MFCNKFHAVTKRSQMHPNTMKPTEALVQGPMGWIGYVGCEKSRRDFVSRTFVLTAPVQYVLHQVSCSYETTPNAPKYCETNRNISLGSSIVDWVRSLRKIPTWLRGTNFCINCTSSPHFSPSFMTYKMIPNAPKHYETHQNMSLGSNGVHLVVRCENYNVNSWHKLMY